MKRRTGEPEGGPVAPAAVAVEDGEGAWSRVELEAAIAAAARRLRPRLPGKATAVALLPRRREGLVALHAVPRAGGVLALLHPEWTDRELLASVARLRPAAVLFPAELEPLAGRVAPSAVPLPLEELVPRTGSALPDRPAGVSPVEGGAAVPVPDDPSPRPATARPAASPVPLSEASWILATSGSSGRPRLVALSRDALVSNARAAARRLRLAAEDRWLASLSLAHVGGLALAVRARLLRSTLVLRETFDPEEWAHLLDEGAFTHASLVPTMLYRLLEARGDRPAPPSLRCLLVGGAATPSGLLERALGLGYPVALTYGLTECGSQVATAPPELVRRRPGTVGPPLDGTRVRLSEEGEILVRGPSVMLGYWDEPDVRNCEGAWLRTGDYGRLDEEGHLWITGRRADRIVSGGVNVDPAEVEEVLLSCPAVRKAVVVGVADPEWGERVVAAVQLQGEQIRAERASGAAGGESAREAIRSELEARCRKRLSGPKRPKEWAFVTVLPVRPTGKPDRPAVRRLFAEE
ncbi:MAG: AMP-binding protein [Gemmatimonadota bacterium]